MKVIIPSINQSDVENCLKKLKAHQIEEIDVYMEYFDMKEDTTQTWSINTLPEEFQRLFHLLKPAIEKGKLESQGLYLTMVDKNERCYIVLHSVGSKATDHLDGIVSIEFHLFEWANVEEMLLEHGFEVVCNIEEKKIAYVLPALRAHYIITVPPTTATYLEVAADTKEHTIQALSEVEYSLDEAIQIEE